LDTALGTVLALRTMKLMPNRFLLVFALCGPLSCGDDVPPAAAGTTTGGAATVTGSADTIDATADDSGTSTGGGAQVFVLADGTEVLVDDDGGVTLRAGERTFFATASGVGPIARRFTTVPTGGLGIWEFGRTDEEAFSAETFVGATQDGDDVHIDFASADGEVQARLTFATRTAGEATTMTLSVVGVDAASSLAMPFACEDDATFYGFGEQYNATDQRGEAFSLWASEQGIGRDPKLAKLPVNGDAHTTYFPMPWFLDARGFGVLVQTERRVEVDLCSSDPAVAWMEVLGDTTVETLIFHGPEPLDVIEQLGAEVGRPPQAPDWAFRPWIGAQGGRDAILAEADALDAASIPYAALWVQDWTGLRPNLEGFGVEYRWLADEELYPDLGGMIAELAGRDVRFLAYVNPFVDPNLQHWDEMVADGLLITDAKGEPYQHFAPNGTSSHPDLTQEAAREYVREHLRAMVTEYGIDGWMADFGEWIPVDTIVADATDASVYHTRFPQLWQQLSRDVMDELRPDGDWVVFARSGWTGVQGTTMVHWVGDQEATWSPHDGLPTVIPAMLNLGLSGVPVVTHDIAGFSGGPSTKELFMRWTELGAFTPIMRTHEGNLSDENWSWESDAETTAHFRRFAEVHDLLAPELAELSSLASGASVPMVQHLMLQFPADIGSRTVDDQFLLGPTLLVAPVVEMGVTARNVYLPPGTWFHVWTGDEYGGGRSVEVDAPIGSPPVFSLGVDRPDLRAVR